MSELTIPKFKVDEWGKDGPVYPKWPDHLQGCDDFNKAIHDHLCDILEARGMSEADVCIASVGMWGAINVTRDYFEKQSALTVNALKTTIADQAALLADALHYATLQSPEDIPEYYIWLKKVRSATASKDKP